MRERYKFAKRREVQKNNTRDSNVVPHRSTNRARQCLTSLSRREAVLSLWYGRSYPNQPLQHIQYALTIETPQTILYYYPHTPEPLTAINSQINRHFNIKPYIILPPFVQDLTAICHVAQVMLGKGSFSLIVLGLGLGCYPHYQYSHIYIRIISFHLTFILQKGFATEVIKLSTSFNILQEGISSF